jgi:hypothetical protein
VTSKSVLAERRRLRLAGLPLARARRVIAHHSDADRNHHARVVMYGNAPHVELWETHDRARRARVVPLRDLVHIVQNMSAEEMAAIAKRRRPR